MGIKLYSTFVTAGLPPPALRLEALIGASANGWEALRLIADLAVTLLPEMERLAVATAAEMAPETLAERMIEEAAALSSVVVGRGEIGAWTRIASS